MGSFSFTAKVSSIFFLQNGHGNWEHHTFYKFYDELGEHHGPTESKFFIRSGRSIPEHYGFRVRQRDSTGESSSMLDGLFQCSSLFFAEKILFVSIGYGDLLDCPLRFGLLDPALR